MHQLLELLLECGGPRSQDLVHFPMLIRGRKIGDGDDAREIGETSPHLRGPPYAVLAGARDLELQELFFDCDQSAVEARDRYLAKKLRDGLHAINGTDVYVSDDPRMSCALVSFTVNGVATKDLNDMLWERHNI